MCIQFSRFLAFAALIAVASPRVAQAVLGPHGAQQQGATAKPEETEVWEPVPKVVTPGATCTAPPSDAIVLFDGTNLDAWVSAKDKSPAKWTVASGVLTVSKTQGNIETKQSFKNYQLHVEWKIPENITGDG